jgi:hypothetical protein
MFKRIMITLTFIAAFGTLAIGVSIPAQAWRGGYYGRPYGAFYAPRAVYYGPPAVPYRAYYGPRIVQPSYYPVYYAPPSYPVYYNGYYGAPAGVSVSFGY